MECTAPDTIPFDRARMPTESMLWQLAIELPSTHWNFRSRSPTPIGNSVRAFREGHHTQLTALKRISSIVSLRHCARKRWRRIEVRFSYLMRLESLFRAARLISSHEISNVIWPTLLSSPFGGLMPLSGV